MFLNIRAIKKLHRHNSLTNKNTPNITEEFQKSNFSLKANAIATTINYKENIGICKGISR